MTSYHLSVDKWNGDPVIVEQPTTPTPKNIKMKFMKFICHFNVEDLNLLISLMMVLKAKSSLSRDRNGNGLNKTIISGNR